MNESIAKQIHEKAAPIVAWLRTAEEESSGEEEDDEEDEVEVVYSESVGAKGLTTITEKPPQPAEEVCVCVCVCVHAYVRACACMHTCVCIDAHVNNYYVCEFSMSKLNLNC